MASTRAVDLPSRFIPPDRWIDLVGKLDDAAVENVGPEHSKEEVQTIAILSHPYLSALVRSEPENVEIALRETLRRRKIA